MPFNEATSAGPVTRFLMDDHRRLEALLQSAVLSTGRVKQGAYDQFRAGLLRHIGMEEKILLPAAQRLGGGEPLSIAGQLRLDHGAIVALLMPTPTAGIIATLQTILMKHNVIEEGPGGLYEVCDKLVGGESEHVIAKLRAAPEPAVLPHSDTPAVLGAVRRALERAGHEYPIESSAS
ncbi:MAG: hemerythrin domain-containing protein [Nitrospira sp.]